MWKYLFILIAYLLGSIPFSYILGKSVKHEDIRKYGSGNIGTTNAFRVFGKLIGVLVLILDTTKSGLMVYLIQYTDVFGDMDLFPALIYGFAAVLGHVFPVWFKFKGGKGVATAFGLLLVYSPVIALALLPIFIATEVITRYVSLASTGTTVVYLVVALTLYFTGYNPELYNLTYVIITSLATLLILIRHKSNFDRIRKGNENKVRIFDKIDEYFDQKKLNRQLKKKNGSKS